MSNIVCHTFSDRRDFGIMWESKAQPDKHHELSKGFWINGALLLLC